MLGHMNIKGSLISAFDYYGLIIISLPNNTFSPALVM